MIYFMYCNSGLLRETLSDWGQSRLCALGAMSVCLALLECILVIWVQATIEYRTAIVSMKGGTGATTFQSPADSMCDNVHLSLTRQRLGGGRLPRVQVSNATTCISPEFPPIGGQSQPMRRIYYACCPGSHECDIRNALAA